ncbi:MAG TPA: YeeE/YedE thiosulfate transporter family protein, partial [Soehngenia sp.]|nr:YeeE/YedE thiosulfate transporter family protein [Soehngenia sp.]
VFIINSSGSSWGASGPYALWTMWLLDKIGIDSWTNPALVKTLETVRNGLLKDPVTVRNIGIIFGSSVSMLLAGKFRFNFHFNFKDVVFYAIGGVLMGYGARVARGCNVGALYSGICNFSLSGWVFLVAITLGGILGSTIYKKAFSK